MAALLPVRQNFVDMKGFTIGIHQVTLQSTSDTVTVPTLANTTASASSAQVRGANEGAVTVTDDGANTVTLASGTAGDTVTFITHHGPSLINYGAEA